MNNRNKAINTFKNKIFEIHEAFSTNNGNKCIKVELEIKNSLNKINYDGWKIPLKPITLSYLGSTYKINFIWSRDTIKRNKCKTVKDPYKREVWTLNYYNKKIIVLKNVIIDKLH